MFAALLYCDSDLNLQNKILFYELSFDHNFVWIKYTLLYLSAKLLHSLNYILIIQFY